MHHHIIGLTVAREVNILGGFSNISSPMCQIQSAWWNTQMIARSFVHQTQTRCVLCQNKNTDLPETEKKQTRK